MADNPLLLDMNKLDPKYEKTIRKREADLAAENAKNEALRKQWEALLARANQPPSGTYGNETPIHDYAAAAGTQRPIDYPQPQRDPKTMGLSELLRSLIFQQQQPKQQFTDPQAAKMHANNLTLKDLLSLHEQGGEFTNGRSN